MTASRDFTTLCLDMRQGKALSFTTHKREVLTGIRVLIACRQVAKEMRENAYAIRLEDAYASHVTEEQKEDHLKRNLIFADYVAAGNVDNFTTWQRVNQKLTGECVPLFQ